MVGVQLKRKAVEVGGKREADAWAGENHLPAFVGAPDSLPSYRFFLSLPMLILGSR
jgi:hypothetical protein